MPKRTAQGPVLSLFKRLLRSYGPQAWWPADTPWEMMVGAILTQNTSWSNVEKAIASLKSAKALSATEIARLSSRRLEKLIRSSGYFRQKAKQLKGFARAYLADPSLVQHRERLLAQQGIGLETADSILLYAAKRPVFVVDAYTRRIGQRLGWFTTDDYDEVQAFFHDRLPRRVRLYNEYHALIVRHAKGYCTKRHPRCDRCPVRGSCDYHRRKRT